MANTVDVEVPSAKPGTLKPYPYHDGQVNENAAIRVQRFVLPLCPVDGNPELKQRDGSYKPNPNYTGQQNCMQVYQLNKQGAWDVEKCIGLGHDPYHYKLRRAVIEEDVDENGYVTDSRIRYIVETRLNIVPVSDNPRLASGQLVRQAVMRGAKTMEEFGYLSPCEFRACSQPQRVDTKYGKFCTERHARLVAADRRGVLLTIPSDPYSAEQAIREREDALEKFNVSRAG